MDDDPARHDDQGEPRLPDLRVGDADRQAALQALGAHLEAGRLDIDEYGDRSALAAVAVRRAELATLFDDLPAPHPALPERPVAVPAAATPLPPVVPPARDRTPASHAAAFAFVMIMMFALPGLLVAVGTSGTGAGLLFLPLIVLLAGGARHGRRRFGPGGPGGPGHGPWRT